MLEIIKQQFQQGSTYRDYHGSLQADKWPKFHWDMYPLAQDYFHELNPYFLYKVYKPEFLKLVKVITVRDGYLTFASFLLENLNDFSKFNCIFLIHPALAPLVPAHLARYFACWRIVHPKQVTLETAKKIVIFSLISDEYLGDTDLFSSRLNVLRGISPETPVELFAPIKKEIFGKNNIERLGIYHFLSDLKDTLGERKLKFLKTQDFFDITDFKQTFFYDAAIDQILTSDNYLHYYVQSRGATVNNMSLDSAPEDSMFSLDLSLYHQLHITPLPENQSSIFTELLFYKKKHPSVTDLRFDPFFQNLLRTLLTEGS